jgi:hypothetical protein
MILKDVPNRADFLVQAPPVSHSERLGHRNLHALDVPGVPDRLQKRVGKSEVEEILYWLLTEEVINAIDDRLGKRVVQGRIEASADARSRPNGFSTIRHACAAHPDCARPDATVPNKLGGIAR